MYWNEIKKQSDYLAELGFDVAHMTVSEIVAVYEVLKREEDLK